MNDHVLEKAQKMAWRDMQKPVDDLRPLPRPRTVTEVSSERMTEKMQEALAPRTGYPDLDYLIRGFIPGHLYTLTGIENVGKTSLACNFAVRVAKQGKKILYFALEPENTVVDYLASIRFDKHFEDITTDELSHDDGNIHIYGKEQISKVTDLIRIVRELDRYDLIIIDHIGYFITSQQNWLMEQSNTIKALAGLAKEKKCSIMMIAHLRKRGPGTKKSYLPTSDDIAGSGSFKQDSTEVMIVVRDILNPEADNIEYADTGNLFVTKTKCGPNGKIGLIFTTRKANIVSVGEAQELRRQAELKELEMKELMRPKELWEQQEEEMNESF